MDNNVIHSRRHGDGVSVYTDSIDRGPRGVRGERGIQGKTGEQGIGVKETKINSKEHLIITLTDGTKVDAGEVPKVYANAVATFTLDGTTKTFSLGQIKAANVSYITINGVEYDNSDYTINDTTHTLTLNLNDNEIPTGELRVIVRSHGIGSGGVVSVNGQTGEVELDEPTAISSSEINTIIEEIEND